MMREQRYAATLDSRPMISLAQLYIPRGLPWCAANSSSMKGPGSYRAQCFVTQNPAGRVNILDRIIT